VESRALTTLVPTSVPVGRDVSPPSIMRWVPTAYGELSWPQVDAIQQQAQRGMTMQFVDLTRRMLRSDSHMLSCYETRIAAVAGAPYSIKPPSNVPKALDGVASLAADDCARAMELLNWEDLAAHMLDAIFLGYSVAEIVWTASGGMVWPTSVIMHQPRRFQFADDFSLYVYDQGWENGKAGTNPAMNALGPALQRDKFIVHTPRVIPDYPTQAGLFYALVRPWWIKSWCLKFWLAGAEFAGNPRLLGTLDQNADQAAVDYLSSAIQGLSADAQGIIRQGASLSYMSQPSNVGQVWKDLVAVQDAAISKLTLGSTLNVEIGESGGNRAASESQDATTIVPRLERDQRQLWETIRRCVFTPFLRFNVHRYGGRMPPIPVGASEIVRQKAEVDDAIIRVGGVSYDELRLSRGLEAWGAEKGGDARVPPDAVATPADTFAPSAAAETDAAVEDVAATALNGAQVTALQGLLASVQAGELAPEAAVIAIVSAFPTISEAQVRRMVTAQANQPATPAQGETSPVPPAAAPSPLGGAGAGDPLRPWNRAAKAALSAGTPTTTR
jgi:phage gp29-like protein